MKTPIQELLEQLKEQRLSPSPPSDKFLVDGILNHEKQLLEKEKEVMCKFQDLAQRSDFWLEYDGAEGCFDKTFNTKEK